LMWCCKILRPVAIEPNPSFFTTLFFFFCNIVKCWGLFWGWLYNCLSC
jgi:hypothetical protein